MANLFDICLGDKAGQTITIRRNNFGGYFCDFDKRNAVRCERKR